MGILCHRTLVLALALHVSSLLGSDILAANVPLVANGNGGMIVFHAPSMARDTGIRMKPDFLKSLAVEYQVEGDETVRTMVRPNQKGSMTTRIWRTSAGHPLIGPTRIRCRWNADATPGAWSDFAEVTVTDEPLESHARIDYGDGLSFTFDDEYPVGQFADGEFYVIAPLGCLITADTPATQGKGKETRHGSTIELHIGRTPFTGEVSTSTFDPSLQYDYKTPINPGQTFIKAFSDEPYSHSKVGRMRTLTVLAQRPPAGTFRPSPYANGKKEIRHVIEIDLTRVPRVEYHQHFPKLEGIHKWCDRFLGRPGFPCGCGSTPSRELYPHKHMHPYHRGVIQDLGLPCHMIMASNLKDETTRRCLAKAYIQRLLDIKAHHRAAELQSSLTAYYYTATTIFAGTLLGDVRMRGLHWYGEMAQPGDYDSWSFRDWGPKYFSWEQMAVRKWRNCPDITTFAMDMKSNPQAQGWAVLLRERTIEYDGPKFDGSHAGIKDNGDGTWTIPANRFIYGGLTARGKQYGCVPVLDPRGSWQNVNVPSAAWTDTHNRPHKLWSYRQQHNPKTANLALVLKALGLIHYHPMSDVYANEAYEFMLFPEEWYHACGIPKRSKSDPWGFQTASPGSRSDRKGYEDVYGPWLNQVWLKRCRDLEPHVTPGPPAPCRAWMVRLDSKGGERRVRLVDIPDDNFSRITAFEISIDSGPWTPTNLTGLRCHYTLHGVNPGTSTIRLRAVNLEGAGEPTVRIPITR